MNIWLAICSLIDKNQDTKSVDLEAWINGIFTIRIDHIQEDPDEPSGVSIQWTGRDVDSWMFVEYGDELTIVPFEDEEAPCLSGSD